MNQTCTLAGDGGQRAKVVEGGSLTDKNTETSTGAGQSFGHDRDIMLPSAPWQPPEYSRGGPGGLSFTWWGNGGFV